MMICHCQGITDRDLHAAIDWMRASDPATIITPGRVYRALGKRAECGGCLPLVMDTMARNANVGVPGNPPRLGPWARARQAQDATP